MTHSHTGLKMLAGKLTLSPFLEKDKLCYNQNSLILFPCHAGSRKMSFKRVKYSEDVQNHTIGTLGHIIKLPKLLTCHQLVLSIDFQISTLCNCPY